MPDTIHGPQDPQPSVVEEVLEMVTDQHRWPLILMIGVAITGLAFITGRTPIAALGWSATTVYFLTRRRA